MAKNDSLKDRRKYQRVLVEPSSRVLSVTVVDHGNTLVFDMSYEGAAFAQPKEKKLKDLGDQIFLHLKTEVDEARIPAKVVRVNDEVVAVHFTDIDVAARIIIDRVVTDRIVGLNMDYIDTRHYSEKTDFDHWFHGPKDTNLYLWDAGGSLEKGQMQMANASVVYEDDMFLFENKAHMEGIPLMNNQQIALKALAILDQIESDLPPFLEFRNLIRNHVQ